MTAVEAPRWRGCHGVRLSGPSSERFGESRGDALADLEIRVGRPAEPGAEALWSQPQPDGRVQRSSIGPGGDFVLELGPERWVSLSPGGGVVTVAEPFDWIKTLLVASFVVPFHVAGDKTLVLHAAAASRQGRAVLIAGPGGTGKSSALVGLAEAGWTPLSEDVCVVDLAGSEPRVWPGPPWVRRRHGEPGPRGAAALFESTEKTAWDVGPFRDSTGATPVRGLFLLDRPSRGGEATRTDLRPSDAIGALAPHAVWLGDRRDRGARLFAPVAEAAARVPVSVLRLPVSDAWVELLVSLLG